MCIERGNLQIQISFFVEKFSTIKFWHIIMGKNLVIQLYYEDTHYAKLLLLNLFCTVLKNVIISKTSWCHHLQFQAALRKISANCGTKVIEDLDAMELVEPRLLDSFLIYSSRQESYVWARTKMPDETSRSLSEIF